jgi:hypothetical protein
MTEQYACDLRYSEYLMCSCSWTSYSCAKPRILLRLSEEKKKHLPHHHHLAINPINISIMASYDSDSSEGEFEETNVLLGYASKEADEDTVSKLGGRPVRF